MIPTKMKSIPINKFKFICHKPNKFKGIKKSAQVCAILNIGFGAWLEVEGADTRLPGGGSGIKH